MDFGLSDNSGTEDEQPGTRYGRSQRGAGLRGVGGHGYGRQGVPFEQQLEQLELDAYTALLKAFMAQGGLSMDKMDLIVTLRRELNISDAQNTVAREAVKADETVTRLADWKKGREAFGGFGSYPGGAPPEPAQSFPMAQGRKKPKTSQLPPPPPPSTRTAVHAAPKYGGQASPPAATKGKAVKGKRKRGRGGYHIPPPPSPREAQRIAASGEFHPYVGRRVEFLLETDDDSKQGWFEAVVTDYRASTDENAVVYDMGTEKESFEWVNFSDIPEDEYRFLNAPPVLNLPIIRGDHQISGRPAAGRGRGTPLKRGTSSIVGARSKPPQRGPPPMLRSKAGAPATISSGENGVTRPLRVADLPPLEDVMQIDAIEREEDLAALQGYLSIVKDREAILMGAMDELGQSSDDEHEEEERDRSPVGRQGSSDQVCFDGDRKRPTRQRREQSGESEHERRIVDSEGGESEEEADDDS